MCRVRPRVLLNFLTRQLLRMAIGPLEPGRQLFRVDIDPYERSMRFVNTHMLARDLTEASLIEALRADQRISATLDTAEAVSCSEAVVVIAPAHLTQDRDIDISLLRSASEEVGKGLRPGTLVAYETMVSVGATRRSLIPELECSSGLKAGIDFCVAPAARSA